VIDVKGVENSFWIWVFDDDKGLGWVLQNNLMGFTARGPRCSRLIKKDDRAIIYTTSNARLAQRWGLSSVTGLITVLENVHEIEPIRIDERPGPPLQFSCAIRVDALLGPEAAPKMRDLIDNLSFIPRKEIWGQYLRRSPVAIPKSDFEFLEDVVMCRL
jgi:predicted RNA-binding protein